MSTSPSRTSSSWLEKAVPLHVALLLIGASWVYGGNIWWMREALAWFAAAGAPLTVAAFFQPADAGGSARRKLPWLIPLVLFGALVAASCLNPSSARVTFEDETRVALRGEPHPGWPSTVDPSASWRELAFGAGVYLSAFNLLLVVRSRRTLRGLLVLIAVNAIVLAVLGTLQKLAGQGFYFGAATSPNARFFSTFIYYNHWGAFLVLCLATACGLAFYFSRERRARDIWHSPILLFITGTLLLATSAPVSASRAATSMALGVGLVAVAHALIRIVRLRRERGASAWPAVTAILVCCALALGSIGWLASRSIQERYSETRATLARNQTLWQGRLDLYRDTWELAMRKPVFGWGLASYETTFFLERPRPIAPRRQYEASYTRAHSDWLQSVAETGLVGTALLVATALVPLGSLPLRQVGHPLVAYPLLGCAVVTLYAWVEFPLANSAVLIAFWTLLFGSLRYAQLLSSKP